MAKLGEVCEHGSLARSCEICERDQELAALRARVAALEAALRKASNELREVAGFTNHPPTVVAIGWVADEIDKVVPPKEASHE